MIRVNVVDSMPIYVKGLEASLAPNGLAISSQSSGDAGGADVFLVNPEALGGGLLSRLVADLSGTVPVLLLIHDVDEPTKDTYARTEVRGFVRRSADVATFVSAIHAVIGGSEFWGRLGPAPEADTMDARTPSPLSPRELQVLRQIARGLTHSQIATRLRISGNTVNTYVKRIRSKLQLGNKAELTRFAVQASMASEIKIPDTTVS